MGLILIILLAIGNAQAGSACTSVRIEAMAHIPVGNQADTNTCYAFAGAQLVDAWRFSHTDTGGDAKFEHQTSPLTAALDARASESGNDSIDSGRACEAVDAIRSAGSCDDREVPAGFKEKNTRPAIATLRAAYDNAHKFSKDAHMQAALVEEVETFLRDTAKVPATAIPGSHELEQLLIEPHPVPFLRAIIARGCTSEHRMMIKLPKCTTYRPTPVSSEKVLETIQRTLEQANPQPAAVRYCSQVLKAGRRFTGGVVEGKASKECRKHVSLVIGRRENKLKSGVTRCQLLIRNSWGVKSRKYSSDWDVEEGNIWVDSDSLIANAYGVSYLE
ncbi:MAG: hypothetical protein HY074_14995 [Deltaproteobacteria bacterium]|nr:hypothetical protein [Deltaproteobacteria bacterium]